MTYRQFLFGSLVCWDFGVAKVGINPLIPRELVSHDLPRDGDHVYCHNGLRLT